MKPSESKVIVIFNTREWNGYPVDLAVPVGKSIPEKSLQWLMQFSAAHIRPLIYTEQIEKDGEFQVQQEVFGYGPPAFQADLLNWQAAGEKLW